VAFQWSAPSPICFYVVSCSANQVAYEGNGTQGSGSFVSVGGAYEFGASCPEGPCAPRRFRKAHGPAPELVICSWERSEWGEPA
jgi:hypothetical protein